MRPSIALLVLAILVAPHAPLRAAPAAKPVRDCVAREISRDGSHTEVRAYLAQKYGVDPDRIQFSQNHDYPVIVHGGDEASLTPAIPGEQPILDPDVDAIVIGGGLGGLTGAMYLSDPGKKILVLEREPTSGGLASGEMIGGTEKIDIGAAYWASPYGYEFRIFKHIGMGHYKKEYKIREPIDSYFWNGKLYRGVWEDETLDKLPVSFRLFKHALKRFDHEHSIPNQPIDADRVGLRLLDGKTAAQWIHEMPEAVAAMKDPASQKIYRKLLDDPKIKDRAEPMRDVLDFLNLYARSAHGTTIDQVNALAFANFYISELDTRYTGPLGTGEVAHHILDRLAKRSDYVQIRNGAPAGKISVLPDGVEVTYIQDGHPHVVHAQYVQYNAPLETAPKLIQDFDRLAPKQSELIGGLKYSHYSVHTVIVKGHPWGMKSYDTWFHMRDSTNDDFTDVIMAGWQDPKAKNRDHTVLTVYHPLGSDPVGHGYQDPEAIADAERAVDRLKQDIGSFLEKKFDQKIEIEMIQTNRWPYSIHVTEPGFFSRAGILNEPVGGRIYFAGMNMGTPSVEEALYRGKSVALKILKKLKHRQPAHARN